MTPVIIENRTGKQKSTALALALLAAIALSRWNGIICAKLLHTARSLTDNKCSYGIMKTTMANKSNYVLTDER